LANRLTKGKALVGSLDVQGELTINGAPVGGGASGVGPEMVYTGYVDPEGMNSDRWYISMGRFFIANNYNDSMRQNWQQGFIDQNNIQPQESFIVTKAEYWDTFTQTWRDVKESPYLIGYKMYAVAVYDMMFGNTVMVGTYGNASYSMDGFVPRLTLQKEG
jgi:hypothetical protein